MSFFDHAHDLSLQGNVFIQNNGVRSGINRLEEYTLKQALRDSSDREILRCSEGTRMAHRKQIMGWAKGQWKLDKSRVMWMDGPAGVGKSAVAQTCADEMGELLSAAFFFSRANGFLGKSLDFQFHALIVQPIRKSNHADRNAMVDTIIVIDGFDECGALSKTFDSFQTQVAIINIITTSAVTGTSPFLWANFSCPETHILSALQDKPASDITWGLTLPLEAPNADEDIRAYFQGAFKTIRRKYPSISPSWPSRKSFARLVEQADGFFIYATKRLQALLTSDETERAKFSKLDRLYLLIMDGIPKETLPSTMLILWAYDRLPMMAPTNYQLRMWSSFPILSSLLGFSGPVFADAISPLQSVLQEYNNNGHPSLRFFHASFIDFLTDPARSRGRYCIRTIEICTQFWSACVDVLCRPLPLVSKRHPSYCVHLKKQEQKEVVVRQAAFTILFYIPSLGDHFPLSKRPDILRKMTQIDWNLQACAYETYAVDDALGFLRGIPRKWRSRIIRPRNVFYKVLYIAFGLPLGKEFVLGHGNKKALLEGFCLEPYQKS
ncbi:hypothetical protein NP233_g2865 [Leucocoprinus birnbaumii]|uniref:NACHT domain-containing protein n=1 Tax=Leucocoprinus birnbaumii TaxID=56174 RepID=A0AAD5VXH9_9AGAR|nr:hypothetical protein NP233_g2865 [Leucocoprinus birnbaumii]